jgi:hypothetical protein
MPGARRTRGPVCALRLKKLHASIQVKRTQSGIPCARENYDAYRTTESRIETLSH